MTLSSFLENICPCLNTSKIGIQGKILSNSYIDIYSLLQFSIAQQFYNLNTRKLNHLWSSHFFILAQLDKNPTVSKQPWKSNHCKKYTLPELTVFKGHLQKMLKTTKFPYLGQNGQLE